jgi:hypothetical protein
VAGWIKLNRKLIDSLCFKDSEILHVWVFLLLDANHGPSKALVGNQTVDVNPGQMITSRKRIAEYTGIQESKVERILTFLKTEQQIEQQSFTKYRIISICNWHLYQNDEQQNEQQVNNKRTANEHIKEGKEDKEGKDFKTFPSSDDEDSGSEIFISKKKRKLEGKRLETFKLFWEAFDFKKGRADAIDSWLDIPQLTGSLVQTIVEAAKREAKDRPEIIRQGRTPIWPQGWITGRRWEDEPQTTKQPALRLSL